MKTLKEGPAAGLAASPLRAAARGWERFWFTPDDPTLLGLIRICCGAITLYTLLAYSFTLQDLFGENAWVNHTFREEMRHDSPILLPPLGWDFPTPSALPPQTEEQKQYANEYKKRWGADPPPPYPRNDEEDAAFEGYHLRWGVDPRLLSGKGSPAWSLWFHVTDPVEMAAWHACLCLIVLLFTIGLCTRITSVLTWAAALWYIHRSPPTLFGVDTMMTILLLYLMIGPSGAALSVDRLLARWWLQARPRVLARWRAFWKRGDALAASSPAAVGGPPEPSVPANFALRLLQIHVCIIYLGAGLSKLQGAAWWNGTAVWGTLANFEFAPMQYATYMAPLRWLAENRLLWEVFMTTAGIFTLLFEIAYVFLIWRPSTRWLMLSMAVVLHGFIGLFMGLKTFSLMMLVMNMAFLSPQTVRRFLRAFTRGKLASVADWADAAAPLQPAAVGAPAGAFRAEPGHLHAGAGSRMKRKK